VEALAKRQELIQAKAIVEAAQQQGLAGVSGLIPGMAAPTPGIIPGFPMIPGLSIPGLPTPHIPSTITPATPVVTQVTVAPTTAIASTPTTTTATTPTPTPAVPTAQLPTSALAAAAAAAAALPDAAVTKPMRELYVGNLPSGVMGPQLAEFLGAAILQLKLNIHPGNPIINTWMSSDGHYAFVEFRTVEECNAASQLNGMPFGPVTLRIGRPKNYPGMGSVGNYDSVITMRSHKP